MSGSADALISELVNRGQVSQDAPCSILLDQRSRWLIVSSAKSMPSDVYNQLNQAGFRRHGNNVLRPHCENCNACVALRVPVETFQPTSVQRYIWRRLSNLTVHSIPLVAKQEHIDLFRRYLTARHPDLTTSPDQVFQYLVMTTPANTRMFEFRSDGVLKIVIAVDILEDGWSLIYNFYDPDEPTASYGVYGFMWALEALRLSSLPYLYPGYWVEGGEQMVYKASFRPFETFQRGRWATGYDPALQASR
jgi:arginyl-tRNA--protein-N-Asp/Glu arginylyltransferase